MGSGWEVSREAWARLSVAAGDARAGASGAASAAWRIVGWVPMACPGGLRHGLGSGAAAAAFWGGNL
jgi:hypothetical protein